MTRTAFLIAAVLAAVACLILGVRRGEALRNAEWERLVTRSLDRDAWPEGVGT